ncbi:RNA polymerase sigma factor [Faecalicatena contorta]|uniref:RNA polymerase sigma-70 factor, ECF subfamily n=1 Tax=Faecalicatena contorta TaxID=39482 RepID=A0A316AEA2_9FIRM|nr:sigma-70 family RNA polymerase sigma factor [Faecalicatena contorta]PWJ48107.1 RNA polymerase sigma-70 factor (ECF subfamily) [Faecalicatena contorta]SUQ15634.1 RNA polymerase sigma-70 factor, ECF subfamily [Faecalicatena contorta]
MEGNHPKRRKDKYNPYNIYEKDEHYYISFEDAQGIKHQLEITSNLYKAFNSFELDDLVFLNVVDRHIEQSEIWESTLNIRAIQEADSVEEIVLKKLQIARLHKAIKKLPEIQQRRLYLYYFEEMTYEQIAKKEHCSLQAIAKSVSAAEKKLKQFLK